MFSGLPLYCTPAGRLALRLILLGVSPGAPSDLLTRRVKRYLCSTQVHAMDVGGNRQICLNLLCINVMHVTIQQRFTRETEKVGFEPTG
jgi:hypothetical protein